MSAAVTAFRRQELERRIDEAIDLLNLLDGDPDIEFNGDEADVGMPEGWRSSAFDASPILEDDEDGADTEANGDELDPNGDEADYSGYADEWTGRLADGFDGSGVDVAETMISNSSAAAERARVFAEAGPSPLVYDLRESAR